MLRWQDLPSGGKMISIRGAAILAISVVLIRLAILAAIKDREMLLTIDDVLFAIGSGLAAIGLLYGAHNSVGLSRKAWMILAIAQIAYALGDVSWAVIEVGLHQNPFPSLADFWYLVYYPIFALGIFLLPAEPSSSRERIKFLLDAGIVVVASVFLFWVFMIAPIIASNEAIDLSLVVSVAYPIMDLVMLAAFMELIFRKLSFTGSKPLFLLALGLVIALIADVIFSIQTQQGTYVSSGLPDTIWLISDMLFMMAGVLQANSKPLSQPTDLSAAYNKSAAWAQYLPYLAIGATSLLLVWGYGSTSFISLSILTEFIAIVLGLAFIRQKVILDESNQLLTTTISQMKELNLADEALKESEDRYHSVVEQASDIIFLYDSETKSLLEGNLAFHRLLGYSIEDIAGLSIYDIVAHDKVSIDSNIEKIKEKKQYYIGRRNYRKKDGSLLDVEVYVNLIFFKHKSILCSIARDITERKLAEDALHRSEQEKAAILDGLKNVSVEYLDSQMHIVWLNSAVQEHLHLSEEELKGKRCFEVIQGIESPCPGCTALKALQTAKSQEGELLTPDGKTWISHSNLIKDANGNVTGAVHVAVNISDRKRAEKALAESENMYRAIFENTGTATIIIEDNTIISLANSEVEKLSGYSREEIEGKISWTEFVVKEDLERMMHQHELRRTDPNVALNNYEFRAIDRNGNVKNIFLRVDAIPGTKKSVASLMDITELKQAAIALQENLRFIQHMIDTIPNPIFYKDIKGIYQGCNRAFEKFLGLSKEEIIGKSVYDIYPLNLADKYSEMDQALFDHPGVQVYEFSLLYADGTPHDVIFNKATYDDANGRLSGLVGVVLDITERKLMEKALSESKEQYKILAESSQDMIYVIGCDDKIEYVNGSAARGLGLQAEEIIGMYRSSLFPPEVAGRQKLRLNNVFETGMPAHTEDMMIVGGRGIWQDTHLIPLKTDDNQTYAVLGISRDITERKQVEEALRSSHQILDGIINAIPVRVFWKDRNLVYLGCNAIFARDAGFADPKDIVGKDDYQMGWRDQAELYRTDDRQVIESGIPKLLIEEPQTTPDGNTIALLTSKIPLRSSEGDVIGVIGTYMDITERKRAEEMLKASLAEKEMLLKEVHHRVKNNLQVISALLYLQSLNLTDDSVIKVFRDCQNRIKSMALIHENLYKSESFGKVNFNEYIRQLISHLSQSYGDRSGRIGFIVNSADVFLNIDTAIPCGMIINELVSNALKYAFPDGRSGEIYIDLSSEDTGFKLVISDNGVGIKEGLNIKDSKTLGFRLIDTLVKQIDGKMNLDTTNGTRCEIHFNGLG